MERFVMNPAAVRQHCVALWDNKINDLQPEVDRIRTVLIGGNNKQSRRPGDNSSTNTLGDTGEVWSGADFGVAHDANANALVAFLDGLVDGYEAYANGAAAAAEDFTETDGDSADSLNGTCVGPTPGQQGWQR